jgi:hypothetical protein
MLIKIAAVSPPRSLPKNSHFFRLCGSPHNMKKLLVLGSDHSGGTAAICLSILAGPRRHGIEPLAYVSAFLTALSSEPMDLESLLPDVWIAAHPQHSLTSRRDEAEAAAIARRRRRERRRTKALEHSRSP